MKIWKKMIFAIVLIAISIGLVIVGNGYDMYQKAIEKNYDKNEILELYLNTSYFGDGYHTAKEACQGYFDKNLNEMTNFEAILLAGIPNAPSVYSPTKNPELARQRQKQVLRKMVEYQYLTQEEANDIAY